MDNMLTDAAIQRVYLLATGKNQLPAVGTSKYLRILGLLNIFKDRWAKEKGVWWASLRVESNLTATVSATSTFDLAISGGRIDPRRVSRLETDPVVITDSLGRQTEYKIVPGYQLRTSNESNRCALVGKKIVFPTAFSATDPKIGGTITIPHYPIPADQVASTVSPTDTIHCDDPDFVCFMGAAEYVRNDVARQNQYGNLVAQAADVMNSMKEANLAQVEEPDSSEWAPLGETWS